VEDEAPAEEDVITVSEKGNEDNATEALVLTKTSVAPIKSTSAKASLLSRRAVALKRTPAIKPPNQVESAPVEGQQADSSVVTDSTSEAAVAGQVTQDTSNQAGKRSVAINRLVAARGGAAKRAEANSTTVVGTTDNIETSVINTPLTVPPVQNEPKQPSKQPLTPSRPAVSSGKKVAADGAKAASATNTDKPATFSAPSTTQPADDASKLSQIRPVSQNRVSAVAVPDGKKECNVSVSTDQQKTWAQRVAALNFQSGSLQLFAEKSG
jgi:hypothetical protein